MTKSKGFRKEESSVAFGQVTREGEDRSKDLGWHQRGTRGGGKERENNHGA